MESKPQQGKEFREEIIINWFAYYLIEDASL